MTDVGVKVRLEDVKNLYWLKVPETDEAGEVIAELAEENKVTVDEYTRELTYKNAMIRHGVVCRRIREKREKKADDT